MQPGVPTWSDIKTSSQRVFPNAVHFNRILDFGCGVGRLTRVWSANADKITGIDISGAMIDLARKENSEFQNIEFVVNPKPDLSVFSDNSFDLIYSHICLQHIPVVFMKEYLREFGRICAPDGLVAFQLPAEASTKNSAGKIRRKIVESLPFGLGRRYRRLRHGSEEMFDVYYTPPDEVLKVTKEAGLSLVKMKPDKSAGDETEGFIYLFQKKS